jgi:hypothetical protein
MFLVTVVVLLPEELIYVVPGADRLVDLVKFIKCEVLKRKVLQFYWVTMHKKFHEIGFKRLIKIERSRPK